MPDADTDLFGWPLPLEEEDELIAGHVGRLRRWCRAPTQAVTLARLRARARARLGRPVQWSEAIATECGLDQYEYVGRHSMLAYSCFLVDDQAPPCRTAPNWSSRVIEKEGLGTPQRRAGFCRACVEEQHARRPYAVWRRTDQIPTTFRCEVHREPLCLATSRNALMDDPLSVLESGDWTRVDVPGQWLDSEPVSKMHRMAVAMLATNRCWSLRAVQSRIKRRAEALGFRTGRGGDAALLSDRAFELFPESFLYEAFPKLRFRAPATPADSLDNVTCGGNTPTAPALSLGLSVLYDSPEEAIANCCAD